MGTLRDRYNREKTPQPAVVEETEESMEGLSSTFAAVEKPAGDAHVPETEPEMPAGPAPEPVTANPPQIPKPALRPALKPKPKPKSKRTTKKDLPARQIRDFPSDVLKMVTDYLGPCAEGMPFKSILLAYIYVTCPKDGSFPYTPEGDAKEIADGYFAAHPDSAGSIKEQFHTDMARLHKRMQELESVSYESMLATEYALFDLLGYRERKEVPVTDIECLEPGVYDMHMTFEEGAAEMKHRDDHRRGRVRPGAVKKQ